jgi:hypothetical protein
MIDRGGFNTNNAVCIIFSNKLNKVIKTSASVFELSLFCYFFVFVLNALVKEILRHINTKIKLHLGYSLLSFYIKLFYLDSLLFAAFGSSSLITRTFKSNQPIGTLKAADTLLFGLFSPGELGLGALDVKQVRLYTNYW